MLWKKWSNQEPNNKNLCLNCELRVSNFLVVVNKVYDNSSHFLGWVQRRCDFLLPGGLDNKKNCFFTFVTHVTLPDCQEPAKTTCQTFLTELVCCRFSSSLITKARARQIDRRRNITSSIIYPTSSPRSNSQEKGFPSLNQTGESSSWDLNLGCS